MSWRWAYLRFTQTFKHFKLAPLNFPHRRFNGLYKEEALNWLITKENTTKKTVLPHFLGIWLWRHIEHPSTPKRILRMQIEVSLVTKWPDFYLVRLELGWTHFWSLENANLGTVALRDNLNFVFMSFLLPFNARIFFLFCLLTRIFLSYRL